MPFFQLPQAPVNNRRMPFCLSFQSRVTARCTINTYIFILHNFLAFVNCFFIIFVIKFGNKAQEGQTGRLPTRPQAAHGRAALKGGRGKPLPYMRSILPDRKKSKAGQGITTLFKLCFLWFFCDKPRSGNINSELRIKNYELKFRLSCASCSLTLSAPELPRPACAFPLPGSG